MALTRKQWVLFAHRYAMARWFWDDADEDINTRADMGEERPDEFIDRMAEHWGLQDPSEPWASSAYDQKRVDAIRAVISRRLLVDRCRVCGALIGISIPPLHLSICGHCRDKPAH
jgi:hypothetical protein